VAVHKNAVYEQWQFAVNEQWQFIKVQLMKWQFIVMMFS
jgi:hypothetical protein